MLLRHDTDIERTEAILRDGFRDDETFDIDGNAHYGVHLLKPAEAYTILPSGLWGVALTIDVPEDIVKRCGLNTGGRCGDEDYRCEFVIPSRTVNKLGCPKVHHHAYSGCAKVQLLAWCEEWEEVGKLLGQHDDEEYIQDTRCLREVVIPFLEKHGLVADQKPDIDSIGKQADYHNGCGECCRRMGCPPFRYHEKSGLLFDGKMRYKPLPAGMPKELIDEVIEYLSCGGRIVHQGKPCIWLDEESRQCKHYECRPLCCRTFDCEGEQHKSTSSDNHEREQ